MTYFSRLTDIVTCNLTEILSQEADPEAAIDRIIFEMQEGISGAERSVKTALSNVERLEKDLAEQRIQTTNWQEKAKSFLLDNNETEARNALARKQELEALIAGLEQQLQAAIATKNHLLTTQKALEARYAEAVRKKDTLSKMTESEKEQAASGKSDSLGTQIASTVDEELEALKKELLG